MQSKTITVLDAIISGVVFMQIERITENNCKEFIKYIEQHKKMPDRMSPHVEGGVILEWDLSNDVTLWVTIIADEIIIGKSDSEYLPNAYLFDMSNQEIFELIPARVSQLKKMKPPPYIVKPDGSIVEHDYHKLQTKLTKQEKLLEVMRKALKYYADEKRYPPVTNALLDGGMKARQALQSEEK